MLRKILPQLKLFNFEVFVTDTIDLFIFFFRSLTYPYFFLTLKWITLSPRQNLTEKRRSISSNLIKVLLLRVNLFVIPPLLALLRRLSHLNTPKLVEASLHYPYFGSSKFRQNLFPNETPR